MSNKPLLRSLVKSFYDAQKLRIEVGNRICQNVRVRLGQNPGEKTEDMPEQAQKLMKELLRDYERIADGLTSDSARAKAKAIEVNKGVIADIFEYELVGYYADAVASEERLEKNIAAIVKTFPIWNEFLEGVKGCGPLMAACIISELDPHKARSISAFWKYAGLDVVVNDSGIGDGRTKKSHHLTDSTYVDKDGKEKTKKGITFNPFLKTKLVGVLGSSFIKLRSPYRDIYDGYKHRLECDPRSELTKLHKHNRAVRYMIKMFLKDLWLVWRELEGLEIKPDYAESKLGLKHGA